MACDFCSGSVAEREVNYSIKVHGKFVVVENVQAKACGQCGESLFSADTVERLQKTVWEQKNPVRFLETPVFDFAAAS